MLTGLRISEVITIRWECVNFESGIAAHTLRDLLGHKTASMADRYIRRANIPVVDATEVVSGALAAIMDGLEPT